MVVLARYGSEAALRRAHLAGVSEGDGVHAAGRHLSDPQVRQTRLRGHHIVTPLACGLCILVASKRISLQSRIAGMGSRTPCLQLEQ